MTNQIIQGDCLEVMKDIPDKSIDMILCDLPYGTTACKWDTIIPFEPLWEQYKKIIKNNGAIVLTGQSLFSANLILSGGKLYRYSLIWKKTKAGGFLNAKRMPLQSHEDILVFYKRLPVFNPQMIAGKPYTKRAVTNGDGRNYGKFNRVGEISVNSGTRYPTSIIEVSNDNHNSLHPTQKPVALFEYLIKTYTNEGDLVLDNCAGSFTAAIASENLKRNWICIEKEAEYCAIGEKRISENRERLHN